MQLLVQHPESFVFKSQSELLSDTISKCFISYCSTSKPEANGCTVREDKGRGCSSQGAVPLNPGDMTGKTVAETAALPIYKRPILEPAMLRRQRARVGSSSSPGSWDAGGSGAADGKALLHQTQSDSLSPTTTSSSPITTTTTTITTSHMQQDDRALLYTLLREHDSLKSTVGNQNRKIETLSRKVGTLESDNMDLKRALRDV